MQNYSYSPLDSEQAKSELSQLFQDPSYYVPTMLGDQQLAIVLKMSRESYTSSSFLDNRTVAASQSNHVAPIDAVRAIYQQDESPIRTSHFIFHTAFCGSTLLSRALDMPGRCLPYKEPYLLHQYSIGIRKNFPFECGMKDPDFLDIALRMACRSFSADEVPVIKPTDTCVNLVDDIFSRVPGSKGIVLYQPLEDFLISTLKNDRRRNYVRDMVQRAHIDLADHEVMKQIDIAGLSDARASAYVWLGLMYPYRDALHKHADRLRSLNSEDFFHNRSSSLAALSEFFELGFSDEDIERICNSDVFNKHSKGQETSYDLEAHEKEMSDLRTALADEISDATEWANTFLDSDPVPEPLPGKLG